MDPSRQTTNDSPAKNISQQNNNNNTPTTNKLPLWNDDLFCLRTIQECEQIFEQQCEQRIDQFAESKEKLSILRSCLDLLNRLEGTIHNRFAGRLLIFLGRVLPLYDQSGVNLRSDFCPYDLPECVKLSLEQFQEHKKQIKLSKHPENGTSNHEFVDIEEGETLSDDDDDDSNGSSQHNEDNSKYYERFWRLQQYLHQPNKLYHKNDWINFRMMVDSLLTQFEYKAIASKQWNLRDCFMTELKSFSLQMSDANFRRCVLVQILIALQYLNSPVVDTRAESCQIDKHQISWIETTSVRVFSILSTIPTREEGNEFCKFITQVLKSEELWNQWKNDKCKEPKLPEINPDDDMINMGVTYHKRRKMSDELKCAKPYKLHVVGSPDMSRLWNKRPHQPNPPNLAKYFTASAEERLEHFKNPNTSFRILRLLRKSPHFFRPTKDSIRSLDEYLRVLSETLAVQTSIVTTVSTTTTTTTTATTTASSTPPPTTAST